MAMTTIAKATAPLYGAHLGKLVQVNGHRVGNRIAAVCASKNANQSDAKCTAERNLFEFSASSKANGISELPFERPFLEPRLSAVTMAISDVDNERDDATHERVMEEINYGCENPFVR